METKRTGPARFNADLQGLRALAILLVVIYHANRRILPGGYVGVDVFFGISGFLITGLLAGEVARTGTVQLGRFWARRARRLLPAAIVVLLATLLMARLQLSPLDLKVFGSAATATSLYIGNIWFAVISTDYLRAGEATTNTLLHYWSLCVEEQFYLLWPLLILSLVWAHRRSGGGRTRRFLAVGLSVVSLGSLATSVLLTGISQPWGFFGTPARAWEFALGGITALVVTRERAPSPSLATFLGVVGLGLILFSAFTFDDRTLFPGFAALLPVLGTCLVLWASVGEVGTASTSFLRSRPMQVLGDLSYSWYLWHWPIMIFLRPADGTDQLLWSGVGAFMSLALASLTFRFVENPARFNKRLATSNGLSIALGLGLALVGAGASLGVRWAAAKELSTPAQQRYVAAANDRPAVYSDGCHAFYGDVGNPECAFGALEGQFVVMLVGDSHAAQWFPALEGIATRRGWRLVSLTKSHCPPIYFEPFDPVLQRPYTECSAWQMETFRRIVDTRPGLVILAASGDYDLDQTVSEAGNQSGDRWRTGVRDALRTLAAANITTAIMRDTPLLELGAPTCLSRAAWLGEDATKSCIFSQTIAPLRSEERILLDEANRAGVDVIDMGSALCATDTCPMERDGMVMFLDDNHLSATFARTLTLPLEERIDQVLGRGAAPEGLPSG